MNTTRMWKALTLPLLFVSHSALAQDTVSISFEGNGAEAGIISNGTTGFDFMGSSWSGGFVATQGITPFYSSGRFSYHVDNGTGNVVFDPPVTDVNFFYVHGSSFPPGSATAFASDGTELQTVDSRQITFFADPANFASFTVDEPIAMIEFNGGVIDDFEYTPAAIPVDFDFQQVEGSWLNPNVVGSGILFDYGPSLDQMFVTWVTHSVTREEPQDPVPADDIGFSGHRFINALLTLEGNIASGDLFVVEGGQFDTPANEVQRSRVVGDITVTFTDCNNGHLEYNFDAPVNLSGEFDIIQLESFVSPTFTCGDMGQ